MSCACIQNVFDVRVSHLDCKYLVLEDNSRWIEYTGYEKPSAFDITISIPSRATDISVSLDTGKRNVFSTVDLFQTTNPLCFPDEIYCLTTEVCGIGYTISRAFLCSLECQVASLIASSKTEEDFARVMGFQAMLDGIYLNAELGKVETARTLYTLLKSKVEHYGCGNCNC